MTPQQLRNSILQQAIEGKLVEQKADEGTAEELYAQIQDEKKKLIADRKIKKEKPLPEISEDEIPFDIPESWKWVRINNICHSIGDIDHKMPSSVEKGIPYISPSDFTENGIDYVKAKQISEESYELLSKKNKPSLNDIIFPRYGTIGKIRVIDIAEKVLVSYSCCTIKALNNFVSYRFILYVLLSPLIQHDEINRYINKTTQPNVGLQSIKNFLFPLPPLAEQKRIVAKIEELLPFVDKYEKAYNALEEYNARFPEDMRKSILQQAIEGKLVEQRAEEGTAEELYVQIQEEKKKLIAEGKIKKEKPLPEISEDEIPFDIPESWKWVRVGNIGSWSAGATPSRSHPEYYGGEIPWLKTGDLTDATVENIPEYITKLALEKTSVRLNPVGSILMAMYGATIGKLGILAVPATTNQACCACICYTGMFNKYLFYYLLGRRKAYIEQGAGGAQPNISKEKIVNSLIPLPPLAEQTRIVAKIEELLPYCDKLT